MPGQLPSNGFPQRRSGAGLAHSHTTYHSFSVLGLCEPRLAEPLTEMNTPTPAPKAIAGRPYLGNQRQDSGYESAASSELSRSKRHTSKSLYSSTTRPSSAQTTIRLPRRQTIPYTRPIRRASATQGHQGQQQTAHEPGATACPDHRDRSCSAQNYSLPPSSSLMNPEYVAPSPDSLPATDYGWDRGADNMSSHFEMPAQTIYYWTSDRTRRIEYAAIDAARRGLRGWLTKYVLPSCFVAKNPFEDDSGSVRRYRLDLEAEDDDSDWDETEKMRRARHDKNAPRRSRLWSFSCGKKN